MLYYFYKNYNYQLNIFIFFILNISIYCILLIFKLYKKCNNIVSVELRPKENGAKLTFTTPTAAQEAIKQLHRNVRIKDKIISAVPYYK
jgi:hypothetical protein